jgi:hypothetical protein
MYRAASTISMHHFVNNLDIVPRLLGEMRLNTLIGCVLRVLPTSSSGAVGAALSSVIQRAGTFVPFGTYHLVLGASLRSVDAADDHKALLLTWQHAVDFLKKVAVQRNGLAHAYLLSWL